MNEKTVKIKEVFESVQGEAKFLGAKQLFIRFCGCNLSCDFCDTDFKEDDAQEFNCEKLISKIQNFNLKNIHSISLTGGEPLLHVDFLKIFLSKIQNLKEQFGFKIFLETNGTLYLHFEKVVDLIDIVSMDLKLESATGKISCFDDNTKFLQIAKENDKDIFTKIVFNDKILIDEIQACAKIASKFNVAIFLQPEASFLENLLKSRQNCQVSLEKIHDMFLNLYKNVYLVPQVHKFLDLR